MGDLRRVFKLYLCIFNQVKAILQRHSIWVISKICMSKAGCDTGPSIRNVLRGTRNLSSVCLTVGWITGDNQLSIILKG